MEKVFILKMISKGVESNYLLGKFYQKIQLDYKNPINFLSINHPGFAKFFKPLFKMADDEGRVIMLPQTNIYISGEISNEIYPIDFYEYDSAYITCNGTTVEKINFLDYDKYDQDFWNKFWIDFMDKNDNYQDW